MNSWKNIEDPFEWDGLSFGDEEEELKQNICDMTARFFFLINVQDFERYTTPAEWKTAIIKVNCTGKIETYRHEIELLWDEYFKFLKQIEQNKRDSERDAFTREMEISFGCSDMMEKIDKIWAKLNVCEKTEIPATERPKYKQNMIDKGILYADGIRVVGKLANVISYLENEENIIVTARFLEQFSQANGNPYKNKTIRNEMEAAHAK